MKTTTSTKTTTAAIALGLLLSTGTASVAGGPLPSMRSNEAYWTTANDRAANDVLSGYIAGLSPEQMSRPIGEYVLTALQLVNLTGDPTRGRLHCPQDRGVKEAYLPQFTRCELEQRHGVPINPAVFWEGRTFFVIRTVEEGKGDPRTDRSETKVKTAKAEGR